MAYRTFFSKWRIHEGGTHFAKLEYEDINLTNFWGSIKMKYLMNIVGLLFLSATANAYDAPVSVPGIGAVYCGATGVMAEQGQIPIAPGGVIERTVDLNPICLNYLNNDVSIFVAGRFSDDPAWRKNKDQLAIRGIKIEIIDLATGANLVNLAKSAGLDACNWGSGRYFPDLRALPMKLRPIKVRLTNTSRNSYQMEYQVQYGNDPFFASTCVNYGSTQL